MIGRRWTERSLAPVCETRGDGSLIFFFFFLDDGALVVHGLTDDFRRQPRALRTWQTSCSPIVRARGDIHNAPFDRPLPGNRDRAAGQGGLFPNTAPKGTDRCGWRANCTGQATIRWTAM